MDESRSSRGSFDSFLDSFAWNRRDHFDVRTVLNVTLLSTRERPFDSWEKRHFEHAMRV